MRIFGRGWILVVLCTFFMNTAVIGQVSKDKKKSDIVTTNGRPDIPGELGIDLGFTQATGVPKEMKMDFWGSNYISPFYKYEFFIPKSNFSVLTGFSFGCERYRFNDHVTIVNSKDSNNKYTNKMVNLDTMYTDRKIKKSILSVNYVEFPLEFRFRSSYKYPKNSFIISVGGKLGFLIDAHTKFKYSQDGDNKKQKQKESFNINTLRYSLTGRIGYGSFNAFCNYSLNPLFEKGKEPVVGAEMIPITFGVSIALF
jgi:hypothetical protein